LGGAVLASLLSPVAAATPSVPDIAAKGAPLVLVFGDSLSAGYGIDASKGWVALMAAKLDARKPPARTANASVSGETTSGGRSRLQKQLDAQHPAVLVIELGANDALRGLDLSQARDNLLQMAKAGKAAGAKVVIVGMKIPPNFGQKYARDFEAMYADVAAAEKACLVPFLLEGVADAPDARDLFQSDGVHPLAKAHPRMLENAWPCVDKALGATR
jgi:acyl-CoA thioesterase-1